MGLKILTHEDLESALHKVARKGKMYAFGIKSGLLVFLICVSWYYQHKSKQLEATCAAHKLNVEVLMKQVVEKDNELRAINSAMTVSLDARKLGRPVRLSGEMIVVFAGKVKE
jgi:hypothetical protein